MVTAAHKSNRISLTAWIVLAVLVLGIFARFVDLGWHFTHVDDIGVAQTILQTKVLGDNDIWIVPKKWNYAPFQYLFTHLLISPSLSYRQLLFWGRLPSAIAGVATLLAALFFFWRYQRKFDYRLLLPLALVAFSYSHIIQAKQMGNYSIGVLAVFLLLGLYLASIERKELKFRQQIVNSFCLALLSSMQYQILFFVPGFFLALFIVFIQKTKNKVRWTLEWSFSGFLYMGLIFPLYHFFLGTKLEHGISSWHGGPQGEFIFHIRPDGSLLQKVYEAVLFFIRNFTFVVESNFAFLPEGHVLLMPITLYGIMVLLICGVFGYARSTSDIKKHMGLFILIFAVTWMGLVIMRKITFAPTRHQLVLLPVLCMLIYEGSCFLLSKVMPGKSEKLNEHVMHGIVIFIMILFLAYFNSFLRDRKDPFVESKVVEIVKKYNVDTVFQHQHTNQAGLMKNVRELYGTFDFNRKDHGEFPYGNPRRVIAWISHRAPVSLSEFEVFRAGDNRYIQFLNMSLAAQGKRLLPYLTEQLSDYEILYSEEMKSNREVEFSSMTKNGGNNLFIQVLRKRI